MGPYSVVAPCPLDTGLAEGVISSQDAVHCEQAQMGERTRQYGVNIFESMVQAIRQAYRFVLKWTPR